MISGKSIFQWLERMIQGDAGKLKLARGEPPFDHCPVCFYSLTNSPTALRCPTCGFECDDNCKAWERYVGTARNAAETCLILLLAITGMGAFIVFVSPKEPIIKWSGFLLFSLPFLWITFLNIRLTRVPRFFAVNSQGLWLRHFRRKAYHFEWKQIDSLRWNLLFLKPLKKAESFKDLWHQWYLGTGKAGIIRWSTSAAASTLEEREAIFDAIKAGLARHYPSCIIGDRTTAQN